MQTFHDLIRRAVAAAADLEPSEIRLEEPRDPSMGDVALPCFLVGKARKQPPPVAAAELAAALSGRLDGIEARAAGPYVNFTIERGLLAATVLGEIEASHPDMARSSSFARGYLCGVRERDRAGLGALWKGFGAVELPGLA